MLDIILKYEYRTCDIGVPKFEWKIKLVHILNVMVFMWNGLA